MTYSENSFNLHDKKLTSTKDKKIEFTDMMKELEKKLNLYHYFEKTIIELYIQFIIYDKKYELAPSSRIMQIKDPNKKYKQIDDYIQNKVKL